MYCQHAWKFGAAEQGTCLPVGHGHIAQAARRDAGVECQVVQVQLRRNRNNNAQCREESEWEVRLLCAHGISLKDCLDQKCRLQFHLLACTEC